MTMLGQFVDLRLLLLGLAFLTNLCAASQDRQLLDVVKTRVTAEQLKPVLVEGSKNAGLNSAMKHREARQQAAPFVVYGGCSPVPVASPLQHPFWVERAALKPGPDAGFCAAMKSGCEEDEGTLVSCFNSGGGYTMASSRRKVDELEEFGKECGKINFCLSYKAGLGDSFLCYCDPQFRDKTKPWSSRSLF